MQPDEKVKQVTISVTPAQEAFLNQVVSIGPKYVHEVLVSILHAAISDSEKEIELAYPTSKTYQYWLVTLQLVERVAQMIPDPDPE